LSDSKSTTFTLDPRSAPLLDRKCVQRGASLIRTLLGPYHRPMPRVLGGS